MFACWGVALLVNAAMRGEQRCSATLMRDIDDMPRAHAPARARAVLLVARAVRDVDATRTRP